ncbi:hypothetical protein [Bradyrhizobium huanghuaihaiense]
MSHRIASPISARALAVTVVVVKTGSRRIIGYLLSPFARYEHDVLRER